MNKSIKFDFVMFGGRQEKPSDAVIRNNIYLTFKCVLSLIGDNWMPSGKQPSVFIDPVEFKAPSRQRTSQI